MKHYDYEYKVGQFALTDGEIELDLFPADVGCAAIHQMFEANNALTFESRDPETRDERYARWGI